MKEPWGVVAAKSLHTIAFVVVESAMVLLLVDGLRRRGGRRTLVAGAVAGIEVAAVLGNGGRCPIADLVDRLGGDSERSDIYLPRWWAATLIPSHLSLIALIVKLWVRRVPGLR